MDSALRFADCRMENDSLEDMECMEDGKLDLNVHLLFLIREE